MFATLFLFKDIISSVEILLQEQRAGLSKTKVKVTFKNGSILFLREIIIENILFDYSYHWQTPENTLITRWDNAAHYPGISGYPHHKHVSSEENILASEERSLPDVLNFIRNILNG